MKLMRMQIILIQTEVLYFEFKRPAATRESPVQQAASLFLPIIFLWEQAAQTIVLRE